MGKHSISHRKDYERALENIETREGLERLKEDWPGLTAAQRGDRLWRLFSAGCTRRGLASDLGCDEGTIRRCLRIVALSTGARNAIEAGANADRFLLRQHQWEERVDDVCRLIRETLEGSVSDELAGYVVWFLLVYAQAICFHDWGREAFSEELDFRIQALSGRIRSAWLPALWPRLSHQHDMEQRNISIVRRAPMTPGGRCRSGMAQMRYVSLSVRCPLSSSLSGSWRIAT